MSPVSADAYPAECECDVVLADGATAHVRPIRPDDAGRLVEFHSRLSDDTIYLRFFSAHPRLSEREVARFTNVDYRDRLALVAELDDQLIAVARYDRVPDTSDAEVAFVVDDANQGRGIGTILLEHLAAIAAQHGIRTFVADTLPHNHRMLRVFRDAGFPEKRRWLDGVIHVAFPIARDNASLDLINERDRRATVQSMERLLRPHSIAIVGASRRRGTIGHELFRNLLTSEFQGPVYPVNSSAEHVAGVRAYRDLNDVPGPVDLAVIAVPPGEVLAAVEECGAKGVHALVVVTAGFAEMGNDGLAAERALVRRAHAHGMRVVGPNCMGVINSDPSVAMNATFAPVVPIPGQVAFASQSGGLGIAILEDLARLGLGVSSFVSLGNKADISGNDLLRYWEQDTSTDVVLLYLESFGNPRAFAKVARRVSQRKPIVAVKAGRTAAGVRAASSHTAALASPDIVVDALFSQTGVIRVDTLEELFDVARVLAQQPLPQGQRVAIIGNAGGPGILAADACEGTGLELPVLAATTQEELRSFLPADAAVANPVDLIASASPEDYRRALTVVLADDAVDAVLVLFVPPLVTNGDDVADAIASAAVASGTAKPIVASFLAAEGTPPRLVSGAGSIPSFRFPESAARALARASAYAKWRLRPTGRVPLLDGTDCVRARTVVEGALAAQPDGVWLDADVAQELVASYGIPVTPVHRVSNSDDAVATANRLGYPVAVKAASGQLIHKTDVGAVHVGLLDPDDVRNAYTAMISGLPASDSDVIIQAMEEPGVELMAGITQDPSFGPLVVFGAGGTAVELLGDRSVRILPVTDLDAAQLVRSLRTSPLLFGYRGRPPVYVAAIEDLLLRLGQLADDIPEIAEVDVNPLIARPDGITAVDVKIRVAPGDLRGQLAVRRLRSR